MDFVSALENALGIEVKKNFMLMQPGDVYAAYADTEGLEAVTGYIPTVSVNEGVQNFVHLLNLISKMKHLDITAYYHCYVRCVEQAYLRGEDLPLGE